tara:strand:+ start:60 stop:371 length:312 start_codon:yes stop_codon:yes gene_type:complete
MTKKNKVIPVDTPKDHSDIKTFADIEKRDIEKTKKEFPIMSKIFRTGKNKSEKELKKSAKKFIDRVQTRLSKKRTETEGSFKKGGRVCKLATKGKGNAYGKNS